MSGRKLGGGRILGSGKGIAPPVPAAGRAMSPFAPSDSSSVSLSRNSTPNSASPPTSDFLADHLTSNVVLRGASSSAGPSSSRLVCPICSEEMVTLLQLNRHLDDVHQELPEAEQDEVKTWFDKQVLKAKRFQPLTLLNSKLRGLDVFESNDSQPVPAPAASVARSIPLDVRVVEPDELVVRKHWQRPTGNDGCTDPACDRRLGPMNGSVNCRKCGRLFCEAHSMYQMKLSRSALHEPVRGIWCRVCETCFKSREGYNDHDGLTRDLTSGFAAVRSKRVDRNKLETQRLEKRLTKLTRLLAEAPPEVVTPNASLLSPMSAAFPGQKNQRKLMEQSVVAWEDDARVAKCPFCQQEFGSWSFRRHHCRICGRVVCADPATACSGEIGLNVANPSIPPSEKVSLNKDGSQLSVDIRMCRDCKATIFAHQDFVDSATFKPPDQRAYETLRQFERGIRSLMPSFQRSLLPLQSSDTDAHGHPDRPTPTHAQIQEAAKIRKRLTDSFAKYDIAAKRIRDLKTTSPTQLRLQKAVHTAASTFLHANLIPLKNLPKILKSSQKHRHPSSSFSASTSSLSSTLAPRRPGLPATLSPLRNGESYASDGTPETASLDGGASEASVQLEAEEKVARERLVVLEEQRFIVNEMLSNARAARRFEEATTLARNLKELDHEVEASRRLVSGVEERWEGLYTGAMV